MLEIVIIIEQIDLKVCLIVSLGQKASVIGDVNSLIKNYLQDKRTIILAVIPANQVHTVYQIITSS
jgi:hypothetical protein